uniref:F-box domain-containing protein n=1 Tax=Rhabditophanes sp. KR3021 TaxID=114890 RepID=A0AC35UI78_9BILA
MDRPTTWITTFQEMSEEEKQHSLGMLIQNSDMESRRTLKTLVEPFFKKDFLRLLPKEISLQILKHFTANDLSKIAFTSKTWNILSEDVGIWKNLCRVDDIKLLPPLIARSLGWKNWVKPVKDDDSNKGPCRAILSTPLCTPEHTRSDPDAESKQQLQVCYDRCTWKAEYLRARRTRINWNKGTPTKRCELRGHQNHVITCLHVHTNIIVTCGDDNTLKIWDPVDGSCRFTLDRHSGGVWTSELSPDGKILISGSTDRTVKVWNTETGQLIHELTGHSSTVRCMALNKKILVTGSRDCTLRVWNIETGKLIKVLHGHLAAVRCVQFDGERIISGAYDYFVKVWNVETGMCIHNLVGHSNRVYAVLFDPVNDIIVSGSLDTTIMIWCARTGHPLQTLVGHQSLTSDMILRGETLISGNADATIKIWNIKSGECIHTLSGENKHASAVTCVKLVDNKYIASSSDDGTVKLWCAKSGVHIQDLLKLDTAGNGGCIWKISTTDTMLIAAVGSRGNNQTEDTRVIMMDFDAGYPE